MPAMSGWIDIDKDMVDDPRLNAAADKLCELLAITDRQTGLELSGTDELLHARNALLGALVTLWRYADEHIRDDDTLPLRCKTLDAIVGLAGFCRLLPTDWIVELDDGTVKLPGYVKKNRLITKRKRIARNRERQAKWRANQTERNAVGNGVSNSTHNGPVTRYASVTDEGPIPIPIPTLKTLRSSSSGDLSPSLSVGGDQTIKKKYERQRQAVEALVRTLAAEKQA
jgi:hypothetical protein